MPHTAQPWYARPAGEIGVRISGPVNGAGGHFIALVDGPNRVDDAALIVTAPELLAEHRATSSDLDIIEMGVAELARVVSHDRFVRVATPLLKRIRARREATQGLIARAEAV